MNKKLISLLLISIMIMGSLFAIPAFAAVGPNAGEGIVNVALTATPTASYTNTTGPAVTAINKGLTTSASNNWNTWGGGTYPATVTYAWELPQEIRSMEVMWWSDNGGVLLPSACVIQYYNGTSWVNVTNMKDASGNPATSIGLAGTTTSYDNTIWNGVEFNEPITTTQIRLSISRTGSGAVGINCWNVYGKEIPKVIETIDPVTVQTIQSRPPVLPTTVNVKYTDGTTGVRTVTWDSIPAANYAKDKVGTAFEVNGTIAKDPMKAKATISVIDGPDLPVIVDGTNIARLAAPSAERQNEPVSRINDGVLAVNYSTSWNTYGAASTGAYPTPVTLTWDKPYILKTMRIMWWADITPVNSSGGVSFPKSCIVEYFDGSQWVRITDAQAMVTEDGNYTSQVGVKYNGGSGGVNGNNRYWNGVKFTTPIKTDKIRLLVDRNGTSYNGIGMGEWEIYGEEPTVAELWSAVITGPNRIPYTKDSEFKASYTPASLEGVAYKWSIPADSSEMLQIVGGDTGEKVTVKGLKKGTAKLSLQATHNGIVRSTTFETLVEYPESIDNCVTGTAAGKKPILPNRVVVNGLRFDVATPSQATAYNNKNYGESFNSQLLPVQWDAVDPSKYAADKAGTEFEVTGKVDYYGDILTAKVLVKVNAPVAAPEANNAVTFENIQLNDTFWYPKQKTNAVNSLNAAIYRIGLESGGEPNFDNAIKRLKGESYDTFSGFVFQDTDIYKTLEAMSYTLSVINDDATMAEQKANLETVLNRWIGKIEAVQYADGYVNTHFALRATSSAGGGGSATHRWRYFANHEMYNAGHFFESAVAYTRYREGIGKPDYRLYEVAKRFADHIVTMFGPGGKRNEVPGHEEVELGLVKIAKLVEEYEGQGAGQKYLDTSKLLIDRRGNAASTRDSGYQGGNYSQDNTAFVNQTNVVGHSVRAAYLYSGAADIAALLPEGDATRNGYLNTLDKLWTRVVDRNTYITGGVGYEGGNEGFGADYTLPNDSSYCEICAAIAMAMWNQRMNLVHEDAKYADVVEKDLYNAILVGTNLEGNLFYYSTKLLATNGNGRSSWFACACCPPNLMRTIASLSGYMYTAHGNDIFVNMYVGSDGHINVNGTKVGVKQETNYPWEGSVKITVTPEAAKEFTMNVRIPGWIADQKDRKVTVKVNGNLVTTPAEKGYVAITRTWNAGDIITVEMPMEVRLTEANNNVTANRNRVVIERGPLVYCMETAGNGALNGSGTSFNPTNFIIPRNTEFKTEYKPDLLKGVVEITADVYHTNTSTPAKLQAIPYYAWNNRGNNGVEGQNSGTRMIIWTNTTGSTLKIKGGTDRLAPDETTNFIAALGTPYNATGLTYTWSIDGGSAELVGATNTANVTVKGVKRGSATLTLTAKNSTGTYTDTYNVNVGDPDLLITDGKGNEISKLSSETVDVTYNYKNRADKKENLTMYVAVYDKAGVLQHVGTGDNTVTAKDTGTFNAVVDMSQEIRNKISTDGYYANIYVWDTNTFAPVMEQRNVTFE